MQVWMTWAKVPGGDQASFKDLYKESLFEKQPTLFAKLPDRDKIASSNVAAKSAAAESFNAPVKVDNTTINTSNVSVPDSSFAPLQKLGESLPGRNLITKKDEDDPFYWMVVWPS